MNKLIIITLIICSNTVIYSKKNKPTIKATTETLKLQEDQINLESVHMPSLENIKELTQTVYENKQPVVTPPNNTQQNNIIEKNAVQKNNRRKLIRPSEWLLESSLKNAPELLKGILFYFQERTYCAYTSQSFTTVPSFHRLILVGPPGTGKTTLAHAIAHRLGYFITYIPATGLLGKFRNDTANNIRHFFNEQMDTNLPTVIIIDEIHKLFEHHANERADDSQSAAAFWLAIDDIEKRCPQLIIIGTANSVVKLPPEIKSRFSGKIITMPPLNRNQKIETFKKIIEHNPSIIVNDSVDDLFISQMMQQIKNCSLRDVQLIIDSAKMFYYAEEIFDSTNSPIILTKQHFRQALNQLARESTELEESNTDKLYETLKKWVIIVSAIANVDTITNVSVGLWVNCIASLRRT